MIKALKFLSLSGMDVFDIDNLEETDKKISELINKNYNTIVVSNEVASFSNDIIKKYKNKKNIKIIIAPFNQDKI